MKALMTGNEAVARGVFEAGCHVASAYPGTPSTEIMENIGTYPEINAEWATNEKVATEVACGASIGGARAITTMKHVGMNVAADPIFTIAYEGVNGGLIIVTADEPGMHSSQNEQDNRLYAPHAKIAMVEPSDSAECKEFAKEAFEISEKYDTPVLFRMTTRVCHSKSLVELEERVEVPIKPYQKDVKKYIMIPAHSQPKHIEIEEVRLKNLEEYANTTSLNRVEMNATKVGIITSGISYLNAKEVFENSVSYLKLGFTYPLPTKLIKDFAAKVDKLYIIEENEPYIENFVKTIGINCIGKEIIPICGEVTPDVIRKAFNRENAKGNSVEEHLPKRPPALCAGCPHRGIFHIISKEKDVIATTDIGCYTLGMMPPLNVGDTCICMGAGFTAGIGIAKTNKIAGRDTKVFGFVGDSTFYHSGITGLIDAVYNNTPLVMVILDNSITAMTGHQENPGTGKTLQGDISPIIPIENIVRACGIKEENFVIVDPYDLEATKKAVKLAKACTEPFVLMTKQPCALIKDVMKKRANLHCVVDQDKCKKCKACMKVGCPAISFKNGEIVIDQDMCNGCSICLQVCPFDAIKREGEMHE